MSWVYVVFSRYIMHHSYLRITNIILICSILYFCIFSQKRPTEYILASLLIFVVVTSQIFWRNPEQSTTIHNLDAFVAKIVIGTFIVYTLAYKLSSSIMRVSYWLLLIGIATSFYYSSCYSTREWCSEKHIQYHAWLHILCFIATFYAF